MRLDNILGHICPPSHHLLTPPLKITHHTPDVGGCFWKLNSLHNNNNNIYRLFSLSNMIIYNEYQI